MSAWSFAKIFLCLPLPCLVPLWGCSQSVAPASSARQAATHGEPAAELGQPQAAARAAAAVSGLVFSAVEVFAELGDAIGDLVPEEDDPCPGGGSASGELGGSLDRPRVDMSFFQCVRGPYTLDGEASVVCDDFDGSRCRSGQATVGEGGRPLQFSNPRQHLLLQGSAYLVLDDTARSLQAQASLQGEFRRLDGQPLHSFESDALDLALREAGDGLVEARIEGSTGFGGDTEASSCIAGWFDTATAEPLLVKAQRIESGELALYSPPPRPGSEQAAVRFAGGAAEATAAGGSQSFSAGEQAGFCAPRD